jgi:hypothetical protein
VFPQVSVVHGKACDSSSTPAGERSERRIDELFCGLLVIVVLIEPAPVGSFNPPIGSGACRVAHDEHPSVAVVHPFTEAVTGFDAVRAPPATITLVAFGHLLGLSAELPLLQRIARCAQRPMTRRRSSRPAKSSGLRV